MYRRWIKGRRRRARHVSVFNAQSVAPKEKSAEIVKFVRDEYVDILFLTETWMKTQGDEGKCVDLTSPGYKLVFSSCYTWWGWGGWGGGTLAVIYRDHFPVIVNTTFPFTHSSFELIEFTLTAPDHIHFFCLYRTPPSKRNRLTDCDFLNEVPNFLEYCKLHSAWKTYHTWRFHHTFGLPFQFFYLKNARHSQYIWHCQGRSGTNPPTRTHHRLVIVQREWVTCSLLLC